MALDESKGSTKKRINSEKEGQEERRQRDGKFSE